MLERIFVLVTGLLTQFSHAQEPIPKNYFRPPIDSTIFLAGNFAELRPNHFHAGIDIKTFNHEGLPIHAVADGYISRMKISTYGYGHVLYVTHPNGYVSVYGHLSAYNDTIGAYMKKQQYAQKVFELELFPKPNELPVKKGEIIAYSGNTGASGGPHLHFEMRDEKTEKAINPLLFGYPVRDKARPTINKVKIYPADENAIINGKSEAIEFITLPNKGNYTLSSKGVINLSGNIYFGIETFDTESGGGGRNGTYSIELQLNGSRIYYSEMNKIGFDESRAINSYIDYPAFLKSGKLIQRSYVEPCNKLGIYKDVVNAGVVDFNTDSTYRLKYIVKDIFGNTSTVEFKVKSIQPDLHKTRSMIPDKNAPLFKCAEKNRFTSTGIDINMPANILYNDLHFKYQVDKNILMGNFSPIYHLHTHEIPVHDFFTIAIKPTLVKDSLKRHIVMARINKSGSKEFVGAEWRNDSIVAKTKDFGAYFITADTIAPVIKPLNIIPNKNISTQKTIEFKISDNFSGIKSFDAYIDDKWILMEYENKQNKIYYTIDNSKQYSPFNTKSTQHTFKLVVTDKANNTKVYSSTLTK